ncbi:MAG: DUF4013 domain-containing protein [Oscillochloridaceae bacterium umkhey_bin13]
MNPRRAGPTRISLREAMSTVQQDSRWWVHCLSYGFAAATGLGLPLTAGFVMESFDNSRRGYPTPLPPWSDPFARVITGLFTLLIDFSFFVLPVLVGGMLIMLSSIGLILVGGLAPEGLGPALTLLTSLTAVVLLLLWLAGAAPLARLLFAQEGGIEEALSAKPLRMALNRSSGPLFLQARLASMGAYLPVLLLAGLTVAMARPTFPGQSIAVGVGIWLTMAALVYAHLVVVQLYVAAERLALRAGQ